MSETSTKRWSATKYLLLGACALVLLVGGFGTWSIFAEISGAVITSGQIEVDRNRQVVQHAGGGVVEKILIEEGDMVAVGDLLIELESTILESELAIVEGQLFEILARSARLKAERDEAADLAFSPLLTDLNRVDVRQLMEGQVRLFQARLETKRSATRQLEQRRAQVTSELRGNAAQFEAVEIQRSLIARELSDQQSLLERGFAKGGRVSALQREQANLLGTAGELTARAAQAKQQIAEIEVQILGLTSSQREQAITQLRDLQFSALELTERRGTLQEQIDRLKIRAPVSGIIYGLEVFAPKSVVRPAEPLMYLIPQDRPLVIATQIEVVDIDQIYVGQQVNLRFPAFDQRRTPELEGKVTLISADAFENEASGFSFYRAEVQLSEGQMERLPADITLIPGMPVEAFVGTADRSPLSYLVKPLADYFTKAFRET